MFTNIYNRLLLFIGSLLFVLGISQTEKQSNDDPVNNVRVLRVLKTNALTSSSFPKDSNARGHGDDHTSGHSGHDRHLRGISENKNSINHDQTGDRALSERKSTLAPKSYLRGCEPSAGRCDFGRGRGTGRGRGAGRGGRGAGRGGRGAGRGGRGAGRGRGPGKGRSPGGRGRGGPNGRG